MEGGAKEPVTVRLGEGRALRVLADSAWTALFRRCSGWTGGDGIYAIPLSGDESPGAGARTRTVFVFGDTFIGEVDAAGARVSPVMVNNTLAVLEGPDPDPDRIRFVWRLTPDGQPASAIVPRTEQGLSVAHSYYWLQDGVVVGSVWTCFPLIVGPDPNGPEGFQFAVHGVTRVSVPVADGELCWDGEQQEDTPLFFRLQDGRLVYFGAAVFPNTLQAGAPNADGFVYVYGLLQREERPQLVVARAAADAWDDFAAWRFWDGTGWSAERESVAPVAAAVSHELSVSPLVGGWWDGRYALVCQLGEQVSLYLGKSPVGPFEGPVALYRCPEASWGDDVYVYNAKAHPHLAGPGELLISYNVNTTNWDMHMRCADVYRPRFVRVRAVADEG